MRDKRQKYPCLFATLVLPCIFLMGACKDAGNQPGGMQSSVSAKNPRVEIGQNDHTGDTLTVDAGSIGWAGIYRGELPCADCAGIQTEIRLHRNKNFSIKMTYEGKDGGVHQEEGKIVWKAKNIIELKSGNSQPSLYRIGNGQLVQLDLSGKEPTGELASAYILHKD